MAEVRAHLLRCAIYTRKSTEEGLEQSFHTLQAQREAAEAYILSCRCLQVRSACLLRGCCRQHSECLHLSSDRALLPQYPILLSQILNDLQLPLIHIRG